MQKRVLLLGLFGAALSACGTTEPATSTTAQMALVLSPVSTVFASTQVGNISASSSLLVSATGLTTDDTIVSITESCPDFAIDLTGLTPQYPIYRICDDAGNPRFPNTPSSPLCPGTIISQSFMFSATFSPSIVGTQTCVVDVIMQLAGARQFSLTGTGTAPPTLIEVTPASLDFGEVRNTSTSSLNLSVHNAGMTQINVSSISVTGPPFALAPGTPTAFVLSAGQTVLVPVECTAVDGLHTGSAMVVSDDTAHSPINIALQCKGVASQIDATPSPVVFATRTGTPQQATVTISNLSTFPVLLQQFFVTGAEFELVTGPTSGQTIAATAAVDAVVRFKATASGAADGSMVLVDDMGNTRTVLLKATASPAVLSLTPDGNFGAVCVGQSKATTFAALGIGAADFELQSVTVPPPFAVDVVGLPKTIKGNGQNAATFTATLTPTQAGELTSTLVLQTDIPSGERKEIFLTATALDPGVGAAPAELDLGAARVNEIAPARSVSIGNCTAAAIAIESATIEGIDAADFFIAQSPMSLMIPQTNSITWSVGMRPTVTESRQAEFVVTYGGGQRLTVPLTGQGFSDKPAPSLRGTYYACSSTSRPGWLGLVGIAALVGVTRRRKPNNLLDH
jgi:hypothetical protein